MKKYLWVTLCLPLILLLTSCSRAEQEYPYYEMAKENANSQFCFAHEPKSLEVIENNSTTIVQGVIVDDSKVMLNDDGIYASRFNVTSLEVTKSIKGNIKEGDKIRICEGYYLNEEGEEPVLVLYGNYMPSQVGGEYIFMLNPYNPTEGWENVYSPYLIEMGRYPMSSTKLRTNQDIDDMPVEQLYLAVDDQKYRDLYREVLKKYRTN